jgi:tripartite-type tricarboxylate transporter receptor subunit TctC
MQQQITRRTALLGSLAAFAGTLMSTRRASSARWPERPIKLIVGGAPGSVPDSLARLAADALSREVDQPVIIENRPGAGGIVAMQSLIGSAPDGHTLALATISQAVYNSYLYSKLSYDPRRDLSAVSTLAATASILVAHLSVRGGTLAEVVAQSQAEPDRFMIGIPASGSPPHIAALLLMRETGLKASFVPFRSGPDALQALLRGDIQLLVDGPTLLAPHVAEGKIKAVVALAGRRESVLPDMPTVAEAGFPGATSESWMGLVAPRATSGEIVHALARAAGAILSHPDYRGALERISIRPTASTPEDFAALLQREHERWAPILRTAGIKLN